MFFTMISIFIWSERWRKKDDEKMSSFLRLMHIESQKNSKELQRSIEENHKETNRIIDKNHEDATRFIKAMHKDTALILGRIFEIVDDPEENKG